MASVRYAFNTRWVMFRTKYLLDVSFVHINKTGGSSIEAALKLPFQHRTALELRDQLGGRRWEERFSFAFVRNPWDRVRSHYFYRVKTNQTGLGGGVPGFNDWVRLAYGEQDRRYYDNPRMFMPQLDWVTDGTGNQLVDFIGRFETLHDDFTVVCTRLGRTAQLPHLKRSSGSDYRALYTSETVDVVGRWFAPDIERFGYCFDQPAGMNAEGVVD